MDALPGALRELALFALVVLAFLGPIEAFLRYRLRHATHRGGPRAYRALADPLGDGDRRARRGRYRGSGQGPVLIPVVLATPPVPIR